MGKKVKNKSVEKNETPIVDSKTTQVVQNLNELSGGTATVLPPQPVVEEEKKPSDPVPEVGEITINVGPVAEATGTTIHIPINPESFKETQNMTENKETTTNEAVNPAIENTKSAEAPTTANQAAAAPVEEKKPGFFRRHIKAIGITAGVIVVAGLAVGGIIIAKR